MIYKYKEIHKKNFNFLKIKEKINCKNKLNTFLNVQKKEHNSYVTEINKKEINLWKNMLGKNFDKNKNNFDEKKEIKELFKKIVFNKYSFLKNKLNDIENKIVQNLIKKYNYKALSEIKNKNNYNYTNGVSQNKKEKVIKPRKINHKVVNSNGIYESNINNKINYFKNNQYSSYNYYNSSKKKVIKIFLLSIYKYNYLSNICIKNE